MKNVKDKSTAKLETKSVRNDSIVSSNIDSAIIQLRMYIVNYPMICKILTDCNIVQLFFFILCPLSFHIIHIHTNVDARSQW